MQEAITELNPKSMNKDQNQKDSVTTGERPIS